MNQALQETSAAPLAKAIEEVLVGGDLSKLNVEQRVEYYQHTCRSLGLNPLTKPFSYIMLNSKLTLYANRDCTDQLRKINGVSVTSLDTRLEGDIFFVVAKGSDKSGRMDASTGAVDMKGKTGEAKANAMMKAETKAKRRLTLSICGLGMTDESEIDSIPGAKVVDEKFGVRQETSTGPAKAPEAATVVDERAPAPAAQPQQQSSDSSKIDGMLQGYEADMEKAKDRSGLTELWEMFQKNLDADPSLTPQQRAAAKSKGWDIRKKHIQRVAGGQ